MNNMCQDVQGRICINCDTCSGPEFNVTESNATQATIAHQYTGLSLFAIERLRVSSQGGNTLTHIVNQIAETLDVEE